MAAVDLTCLSIPSTAGHCSSDVIDNTGLPPSLPPSLEREPQQQSDNLIIILTRSHLPPHKGTLTTQIILTSSQRPPAVENLSTETVKVGEAGEELVWNLIKA